MAESQNCDALKILCIHGYRQNAQSFRQKTGAFRKLIKKKAELVFITAPNHVPPSETSEESASAEASGGNDEGNGWWFSRADDYFQARDPSDCCKGYDLSLQTVLEAVKEQGPFDGVLGSCHGVFVTGRAGEAVRASRTLQIFDFIKDELDFDSQTI